VTTVVRSVTVAAGVFAPGHLGELTRQVPFELVDAVLEQTRATERRLRILPSRVGVYFVVALALFPGLGSAKVWAKLIAGLDAGLRLRAGRANSAKGAARTAEKNRVDQRG
jgi:Insertion element 4 transposase N-terminal